MLLDALARLVWGDHANVTWDTIYGAIRRVLGKLRLAGPTRRRSSPSAGLGTSSSKMDPVSRRTANHPTPLWHTSGSTSKSGSSH